MFPGLIDLLIDRSDHTINLCKMKYSESGYLITKAYEEELKRKKEVFKRETKTKKTVFVTMITTLGVQQNNKPCISKLSGTPIKEIGIRL